MNFKGKEIYQIFPYTSPELLDILESMIQFNPFFRLTTKELLKKKIFDKIRQPLLEKPAPNKISVPIDSDDFEFVGEKAEEDSMKHMIDEIKLKLVGELIMFKQMDGFGKSSKIITIDE